MRTSYLLYLILILCTVCPSALTDGFNLFKERIMKNSNDPYNPVNRNQFNRNGRFADNAYQQSPYRVPKRIYYGNHDERVADATYSSSLSDVYLLKALNWILLQARTDEEKQRKVATKPEFGLKYTDGYFIPILKAD